MKLQPMYLQAICNCWIKSPPTTSNSPEVKKAYDVFKHAGETMHQRSLSKMTSVNEVVTICCSYFFRRPADILVLFFNPKKANDSFAK